MQKPTIQSLHKSHYNFTEEQKASIVLQYSITQKQWKFVSYSCRHCGNNFKGLTTCYKHFGLCKELNSIKKREKEMPIQVVTIKGERYYKWGDSGKPYKTRAEAEKQAAAAYASGYKEKKDMKQK